MTFVVQTNLASLKHALRATVARLEAPAADYIDWHEFEAEAERLLATDMPTKKHLTGLVARHVTRARQAYRRAVLSGARLLGQRPN